MNIWVDGEWRGEENPVPVHQWCQMCDPEGERVWDPWEPKFCELHFQSLAGSSETIIVSPYYCAQGDAGGEANRNMCELLHGRST